MDRVQRLPIPSRTYSSTAPLQQIERRRPTMIKTDDLDMPISPREHETRVTQRATADRQKQRIEWNRKVGNILKAKGHNTIHNTLVNIDKTTLGLIRIAGQIYEDILRAYAAQISSMRIRLEKLLQNRWQKYYSRSKLSRLDYKGGKIEKSIQLLQYDFSGIRARLTELNANIATENKQLISAAEKLIESTSELKSETGVHIKITNSTSRVVDGARDLEAQLHPQLLCEIELELIRCRSWQPVSELGDKIMLRDAMRLHRHGIHVFNIVDDTKDRTALTLRNLFAMRDTIAPYEVGRSSAGQKSKFARLLHFYRRLDLSTRAEKIFPGMRYNQHWANVVYIDSNMPWEMSNTEFHGFLHAGRIRIHHMLKVRLSEKSRLQNRNQRGESARQLGQHKATWARLSELYRKASLFSERTADILQHHRTLLAGGLTKFCIGHPYPDLHDFQCRNFRIANTLMSEHLALGVVQKHASNGLNNIQKESGLIDDMQHLKARNKLVEFLDNSEKPQRVWRREMSGLLSEAETWSSLNYLTKDRHQLPSVSWDEHARGTLLSKKFLQVPATTQIDSKQRRPTAWLRDKSLYPARQAIFIDYVISTNALAYVLYTIRSSKILAFDISFNPQSSNQPGKSPEIEFLMLATESQVVLIDWSCLTANDRVGTRALLKTVLEEESILKLFSCKDHALLLWSKWVTNVNNYITLNLADVREYVLEEFPVGADVKLPPVDAGRLNSTDPRDHFYALAFRPYAILRAFHIMHSRGVIEDISTANSLDLGHHQSPSDEMNNGVFGPVFIDRSENIDLLAGFIHVNRFQHNISPKHTAKRVADYDYPTDNRQLSFRDHWLNTMSWRLARFQILKYRRTTGSSKSTNRPLPPHVQKAYAAYFQFTIFHENLYNIAFALSILRNERPDVAECASRILWAAQHSKMQISDRDMIRLKHASRSSNTQSSQEELLSPGVGRVTINTSEQRDRKLEVSGVIKEAGLPPTRRRRSPVPQIIGFKSVDPPKKQTPSTRTTHELEQSAMMEERELDWKPKSLRKPLRALRVLGNTTSNNNFLTFAPTKPGTKKPRVKKKEETVLYQPPAPSANISMPNEPLKPGFTRVAVLTGYPPRSGIQIRRVNTEQRKLSKLTTMRKLFSKPALRITRRLSRPPVAKNDSVLITKIPNLVRRLKSNSKFDHDFD